MRKAAPESPSLVTLWDSLGTEVISCQTGIVNLEQDAGIIHSSHKDLKRWQTNRSLSLGWLSQASWLEAGIHCFQRKSLFLPATPYAVSPLVAEMGQRGVQ